jgi:hypothetical protein
MTDRIDVNHLAAIRDRVLDEADGLPSAIGRYRVRGELGRGGMGIVYDAYDPQLDREVAVKVLRRDDARAGFLERFEREMRATSRIFHENLVSILDAGLLQEDGATRPFYVMERVDGPSLEEWLVERGPLEREEGLRIAAAIARGLAAVHAHGLVHRDLKPANVLLPPGGPPKVTDFGLCNLGLGDGDPLQASHVLGSAHYAAPEQVRSTQVTASTDLFALGGIVIRMLAGEEPFRALSLQAHLARILHDVPDGLDRLDPDVRGLVLRLMAKRAERRPADAACVARRLEAMAAARPGAPSEAATSGAAGDTPSAPVPRRRRLLGWLAASASLVLLAGAIALLGLRNDLIALESAATTQWKQVENQLARQHELIPKLVTLTERYLRHEDQLLARLLEAPGAAGASARSSDPVADAARLERALLRAFALAERSPGMRADRQFRALAREITGTKNRIAVERARYNDAVDRLNRRLEQLPWRLVSGSMASRAYYEPRPAEMTEPDLEGGA